MLDASPRSSRLPRSIPLQAGIAVDAHAVAHSAAEQLIDRDAQGFAGDVPQGDFDGGERGDVLAALRAGEHSGGADSLERGLDVERVLADEHPRNDRISGTLPCGGIGPFALADDALIRVDAHVHLITVDADFGGTNFGDFEFRPAVLRYGGLESCGNRGKPQHAGERHG